MGRMAPIAEPVLVTLAILLLAGVAAPAASMFFGHHRCGGPAYKVKAVANLKAFGPAIELYKIQDKKGRLPMGKVNDLAHVMGVLAINQHLPRQLFDDPKSKGPKAKIDEKRQLVINCSYGINRDYFSKGATSTVPVIATDPAFYEGDGSIILQTDNSSKYYTIDSDVYKKAFGDATSLDGSKGVITR